MTWDELIVPTDLPEVVDEIKALADGGYREVVLTGANVGCYRDGSHRRGDWASKAVFFLTAIL